MPLSEKVRIVAGVVCVMALAGIGLGLINLWERGQLRQIERAEQLKQIEERAEREERNRLEEEKIAAENKAAEERGKAKAHQ